MTLPTTQKGLKPLSAARGPASKVVPYSCPVCLRTFLGVRGLSLDWPPPGHGLPGNCGHPDCLDFLAMTDIQRGKGWDNGVYTNPVTKERFRLAGFDALAARIQRRVAENQADEEAGARGEYR